MRIFNIVSAVLAVFISGAVVTIKLVAPDYIAKEIKASFEANCQTCKLKIGDMAISLLNPGTLVFHKLTLKSGDPASTGVTATVERVDLDISLSALRDGRVVIKSVTLERPLVTLVDGDKKSGPDEKDITAESYYAIDHTTIYNGTFIYVRNRKGTSATLHINDIRGTISAFGNTPALKTKPIIVNAKARVEKSGEVDVKIVAPWRRPFHVDVGVEIKNQNLADTTPFFKENAGVELNGILVHGRATVAVRGDGLEATVWSAYEGLGVRLIKNFEQNEVQVFLMNIGMTLAMNVQNVPRPFKDQVRSVKLKRESDEPVVGFILRGMKEAAIKVSMARDNTAPPAN